MNGYLYGTRAEADVMNAFTSLDAAKRVNRLRRQRRAYAARLRYRYYTNCVNWLPSDVHTEGGLCDLIDACVDITRGTFLRHVNRSDQMELEKDLGYDRHPSQGLTMASDWHVSYHRSKLHGRTVYLFKHSAIEYVFREPSHR